MNIQLLKYFIEIADVRNLSTAARNLFVTQPSLSLALKKMETELEASLFDHTNKPYDLTDVGLYVYNRGTEIVNLFDDMMENVYQMNKQQKKHTIILGSTTLFSIQYMEQISKFLSSHPNVDLVLRQDGSPRLQTALAKSEIDIGILSFPNTLPKQISMEPLHTRNKGYHVYVVIPDHNPLSKAKELTFKDLKGQKFSSLTTNFMLGRLLLERTRAFGYTPDVDFYYDDLQVLLTSLNLNDTICLMAIEYRGMNKEQNLNWVPLKDKYAYYPIGIALRKDYTMPIEVKEFIDALKEN